MTSSYCHRHNFKSNYNAVFHCGIVLLLMVITSFLVDLSSSILVLSSFILGYTCLLFKRNTSNRNRTSIVYCVLFEAGWLYMLMCYGFMVSKNFDWLLSFDSYDVIVPQTLEYISQGHGNILNVYEIIFTNFDILSRNEYFYWIYTCTWGIVSQHIGASLYLGLQTSTLLLYSFCGVFLYKLFLNYNFSEEKSFKHTIVILITSIIFFYSSQILRDIHVLLLYLIAFYLSSKQYFSVRIIILLSLIVLVTCGIRVESGLFLSLIIPIYLLSVLHNLKSKVYVLIFSVVFLGVVVFVLVSNYDTLQSIYYNNNEYYMAGVTEGTGVIGFLQRIPVVGPILSVFYNASLPLPVWARLFPDETFGSYTGNILNFTRISAVIFNIYTYVCIITYLLMGSLRSRIKVKIPIHLQYQIIVGCAFLLLQSSVISQRRLMSYYCVFYILMYFIHDQLDKEDKKTTGIIFLLTLLSLHIVALIYK